MANNYTHIFLDQTSNQRLSTQAIQDGASGGVGESGAEIATGGDVVIGVTNQLKQEIGKKIINQPLNQITNGLWRPATSTLKAILSGAGWGAIAGGLTALAFKGAEMGINAIIQAHEDRIKKLENEATVANNADNALILAGKMNSTTVLSYNKYGKADYGYDRR